MLLLLLLLLFQVRVENIQDPEDHIPEVLNRVKKEYLLKTYKIEPWTDATDFLEKYARRSGKLLKVISVCFALNFIRSIDVHYYYYFMQLFQHYCHCLCQIRKSWP